MAISGIPRLTIGLAGTLICVFLLSGSVHTYYDDTHYGLTYYMARSCGYTATQAYRIASADVGIDYSDLTEPVQTARMVQTGAAAAGQGGISVVGVVANSVDPIGGDFQEPRVKFHAFRDARPLEGQLVATADQRRKADADITAQELVLRGLAQRQRNPGVLLHFIQDEVSHRGYASLGGHWASSSNSAVSTLADSDLPEGATTDYLSYNPPNHNATREMIENSIELLKKFMEQTPTAQRGRDCSVEAIADLADANGPSILQQLVMENRIPDVSTQYIRKAPGDVINRLVTFGEGEPNASLADRVVFWKLGPEEVVPYRPSANRIPYDFDRNGNVTNLPAGLVIGSLETLSSAANPLDGLTLYGNLRVSLGGPGATGRPVQVSVWAAPTRNTEAPYQLDCQIETTASAEFFDLPVGDIIIQALSGKVVTRKRISLNRLMQNEVLSLPANDRVANECPKPVEPEAFTQACMISRGAMARRMAGTPMKDLPISQFQKTEAPIQGLVDQAGSCQTQSPSVAEQKKPASPPATTKKGMSGATKAAVTLGALGGTGLVAAKAYQDYKDTQKEIDAAQKSIDSLNGGSSGSSGSSANKWDGTYVATRTSYSCTPKATCGDLFPEPGCPVTPFTFTVSGGVIRDNCGNFPVVQIPSSGAVSFMYFDIRLTGTWSTSTFILQGTGSSSSGTYNATFSITKK